MTRTQPADLDVFYPIVPDLTWLQRIVPLGVRTVQLRLKDANHEEILRQVRGALEVCIPHRCQLIVNDHWREALLAGADYVHLGQEDLATADISTLKARDMRVGISTHDEAELKTALAVEPDYIALGPIWETKLKAMVWAPQGVDKITHWRNRIGALPLVAIGGITPERAPGVIAAGADCAAVITDFITDANPERRVTEWWAWARSVVA